MRKMLGRSSFRLAMAASIGILFGRFVIPALEIKEETTAIIQGKEYCFFPTAVESYWLTIMLSLADGGKGLKCNERIELTKGTFLYCECSSA